MKGITHLSKMKIMKALAPNGLEMGDKHVLQTNMQQCVTEEVPFDQMTNIFFVCALAEQSASDSGTSVEGMIDTKFVVGHLNVESNDYFSAAKFSTKNGPPPHPLSKPVELHGVKALLGKEVFESIAQGGILFHGITQ